MKATSQSDCWYREFQIFWFVSCIAFSHPKPGSREVQDPYFRCHLPCYGCSMMSVASKSPSYLKSSIRWDRASHQRLNDRVINTVFSVKEENTPHQSQSTINISYCSLYCFWSGPCWIPVWWDLATRFLFTYSLQNSHTSKIDFRY